MNDSKSKWIRDLLVIPLFVGLVIGFVTFLLPKILADKKEISYTIDGPTKYFDNPALGNISVEVNGKKTSNLNSYRVRLWNSGNLSLRDVPVRFVFGSKETGFSVLNVNHQTNPPYEFGKITEEANDEVSRRFLYELLNPGDEDIVTFLANQPANLQLFSKSEGLKLTPVPADIGLSKWEEWFRRFSVVISVIAALSAMILKVGVDRFFKRFLAK